MVFQAPEERNYHIFYQLCASREEEEYTHLHLDEPEEFIYLNHGECTEIDDVDDAKELESTKQALNTLGMCDLHSKMSASNVPISLFQIVRFLSLSCLHKKQS